MQPDTRVHIPPTSNRPQVRQIGENIEAVHGDTFVIVDGYTGETVATNVPVGSDTWRRLARLARNYVG